jgi:putative membrane protein
MGHGAWWWHGSGWLFMLLFWLVIVLGIIGLVRWLSGRPPTAGGAREKTALDIVRERYARGEIDRAEYEQKLQDLQK